MDAQHRPEHDPVRSAMREMVAKSTRLKGVSGLVPS